jgi:hypothetical protein
VKNLQNEKRKYRVRQHDGLGLRKRREYFTRQQKVYHWINSCYGFSRDSHSQRPATPHAERQIGSLTITQHQSRSREALNPSALLSQSNIVRVLPHHTNPTIFPSTQTSMIIFNNYRNGNSISSRISSSTTERSPQCPTFTTCCHQTNHFMPYQTVQWHTTQRALDGCSGRRTDND